jgi:hypothetical protein
MASKARYLVRIDPEEKCVHVNLVKKTNVPGEEEYLFAPCESATTLGTTNCPWLCGQRSMGRIPNDYYREILQ